LRQRHYRQRKKEKVTYQGSPGLAPYDLLIVELKRVTRHQKSSFSTETSTFNCHFCGCRCSELLRWVFLHQQPRQSLSVHTF
jgi:hypothetical protein